MSSSNGSLDTVLAAIRDDLARMVTRDEFADAMAQLASNFDALTELLNTGFQQLTDLLDQNSEDQP